MQLLPILVLFGFSILTQLPNLFSSPPPPDPTYTFEPTVVHTLHKQTQNLHADYYLSTRDFMKSDLLNKLKEANPTLTDVLDQVDSQTDVNFQPVANSHTKMRFPRAFVQFESRVESTLVHNLSVKCQTEQDLHQRKLLRAGGVLGVFGRDEEELRRIRATPLPACDRLNSFGYSIRRN